MPEEPSPKLAENRQKRAAFAGWLHQMLSEVIGPPSNNKRPRFLNEKAFLKAMSERTKVRGSSKGTPDLHTFQNWRAGKNVPSDDFVDPLFDVLLNDSSDSHPERKKAWELWQEAEDEKNAASNARRGRPIARALLAESGTDDVPPGESYWDPGNAEPLQRGLAELIAYPPPRSPNNPNQFQLRVSLSFAECPDELEDVTLALTDATLVPNYDGCRPLRGTRQGEGAPPDEPVLFRGGNWRINGPRLANGHLQGEPLGDYPLCTIECDGESDDSLTLTLRSGYRALVVIPDDSHNDPNPLRLRVWQALLQRCLTRDNDKVVTWGRATLRRKPSK